jgi:hypothetical protein
MFLSFPTWIDTGGPRRYRPTLSPGSKKASSLAGSPNFFAIVGWLRSFCSLLSTERFNLSALLRSCSSPSHFQLIYSNSK